MSIVMIALGALSALGGITAIGYGFPVKEFSFGNTLILVGAIALMGGLILVGLGATIAQLKRVVELLGARPLSRAGRGVEPFDAERPAKPPFPIRRAPLPPREPPRDIPVTSGVTVMEPASSTSDKDVVPALSNPAAADVAQDDEVELPFSPRQSPAVSMPAVEEPQVTVTQQEEQKQEPQVPLPEPPWRQPHPSSFEAMWPAEPRPATQPPEQARAETIPRATSAAHPPAAKQARSTMPDFAEPEPPAVAILKSGTVDGMGYTLYVDGSIEAELPDGTVHFASIGDLRSHLEQNA